MGLKLGYKQTEVGAVPEDWEVTNLASVCSEPMQNGVFYTPSRKGVGVKLINVGDLYKRIPIDSEMLELFDANENEVKRFKVEDGDLFFTRSSVVPSGIAHCNIYSASRPEPVVFDSHIIRIRPDTSKVISSYLFRFCVAYIARKYLVSHAKTATMTTIDQSVLGKCPVLLPTKTEQEAIAEALSDVDALIESLEQLIAKKRHIKQGVIRELLRPKDGWRREKLGNLATIQRGASPRPIDSPLWFNDTSSIGWVRISDVPRSGMFLYETTQRLSPLGVQNSRLVSSGSLIMSICATVGRPIITQIDTCIHDGFVVFENLRASQRFMYYMLKSIEDDWTRHGQTGSQMNLNTGLINRTEITIPVTKEEQEEIAEVIFSMDAEIAALDAKLDKARRLKQGMMHNLLTGSIRLV